MSHNKIPRRLFMRGAAGVVVGLPILESMDLLEVPLIERLGPQVARAQQMPFKYAVFMRQGNGCLQQREQLRSTFDAPVCLRRTPLARYRAE